MTAADNQRHRNRELRSVLDRLASTGQVQAATETEALHAAAGMTYPQRRSAALAMGRPDPVERFLARLRATHPDFVRIYTQGGCFQLFLTLREIWPNAAAWCDLDHVWTEIGGRFYDIRGRHLVLPSAARPIDPCVAKRAHRWHHRNFFHKRIWREVLELPPTGVITMTSIDARYRRLASIHHPDKAGGSPEAMAELNVARDEALASLEGH